MSYITGGIGNSHYPAAGRDDERVKPCCAKCRRGVPGFGTLPCGYDGKCKCHAGREQAQAFLDLRAAMRSDT